MGTHGCGLLDWLIVIVVVDFRLGLLGHVDIGCCFRMFVTLLVDFHFGLLAGFDVGIVILILVGIITELSDFTTIGSLDTLFTLLVGFIVGFVQVLVGLFDGIIFGSGSTQCVLVLNC